MKGVTPPVSLFYQAETSNQFEYSIKFHRTKCRLSDGSFHHAGRPSPATRGRTSAKPFRHPNQAPNQGKNVQPRTARQFPPILTWFSEWKIKGRWRAQRDLTSFYECTLRYDTHTFCFYWNFSVQKFEWDPSKIRPASAAKSTNCRRLESEMRHLKIPLSELPSRLDLGIRQRSNSTRSTPL